MPKWTIQFDGGFAWMFDKRDKEVTVAIPKKPAESTSTAHEMILVVHDERLIDERQTTLPGTPSGSAQRYVIRGEVEIKVDDEDEKNTGIKRTVSDVEPPAGVVNDFYFVYSIPRFSNKRAPGPRGSWKDHTLANLKLDGGTLVVHEPKFESKFDILDGNSVLRTQRKLSSSITYTSDTTATRTLSFETDDGNVVLQLDGSDVHVTIRADCSCSRVKPAATNPLKGFDLIFALYSELNPEFQFVPHVPASGASAADFERSPGPDCPPSDHEI